MDFFNQYGIMILEATLQTLLMVVVSVLFGYLLGMPLGILAYITAPGSISPQKQIYAVLDVVINLVRSVPFIILLVAIIPFTKLIVGTFIGPAGAIVPLTVAAAPFVARMTQTSLNELDRGVLESCASMGATKTQLVTKVLLPEALPSLVQGMSITTINLVGYTAMAGTVGAGGLGDVALRYGYQRYQSDVMLACIVILVIMVQLIQLIFDRIVKKLDKNV